MNYIQTISANVHRENNCGKNTVPYSLATKHVLEGLVATAQVMDMRVAEEIMKMCSPVERREHNDKCLTVPIEAGTREEPRNNICHYDFTSCEGWAKPRQQMAKEMLLRETDAILDKDSTVEIKTVRIFDGEQWITPRTVKVFKSAAITADKGGAVKRITRNSRIQLAKVAAQLRKMLGDKKQMLACRLTISGILGKTTKNF